MMETLILRNARRISDLENKNRVAISNVSMESKKISNEGSTLKASSGVITSNVPLKAPNIPDDLKEKVELIDTMETRLAQCESDVANKADAEHTHTISDITDLQTALDSKADKDNIEFEEINIISGYNVNGNRPCYITLSPTNMYTLECNAVFTATNIPSNLWEQLTDLQENKADVKHTHTISEIEQLNDTLDNKADKGNLISYNLVTGINWEHNILSRYTFNNGILTITFTAYSNNPPTLMIDDDEIITPSSSSCSENGGDEYLWRLEYNISKVNGTEITFIHNGIIYAYGTLTYEQKQNEISPEMDDKALPQKDIIYLLNQNKTELKELINSKADADHKHTISDITDLNDFKNELLQTIYPVGSIYTSMNNTSPATLFGFGTWTQIVDRFLYCSSSSNTTGGSATHTHTTGDCALTVNQMPAHFHNHSKFAGYYIYNGGAEPKGVWNTLRISSGAPSDDFHTVYTGVTGGGQAHNHGNTSSASNLPPYITVYCWYRRA